MSEQPPARPRWVKAFLIVAIVAVLLVVVVLLVSGGHGPGRHSPSGSDHTPAGNMYKP